MTKNEYCIELLKNSEIKMFNDIINNSLYSKELKKMYNNNEFVIQNIFTNIEFEFEVNKLEKRTDYTTNGVVIGKTICDIDKSYILINIENIELEQFQYLYQICLTHEFMHIIANKKLKKLTYNEKTPEWCVFIKTFDEYIATYLGYLSFQKNKEFNQKSFREFVSNQSSAFYADLKLKFDIMKYIRILAYSHLYNDRKILKNFNTKKFKNYNNQLKKFKKIDFICKNWYIKKLYKNYIKIYDNP